MPTNSWTDSIPLWLLFVVTLLGVLAAIEAGYRLAVFRKRTTDDKVDGPIGSVVAGTLGLLAFLLAFTFGMAASRFDARRELLLDEVNAIGTCYLRAGMMPGKQRIEIRERLRAYVHLRAEVYKQPQTLTDVIARCDVLLDELWLQAETIAKRDTRSPLDALFVESLNDVIDFHTKRIVVAQYNIPTPIWMSLYFVSALSVAGVGYQFGHAGGRDLASSLFLAVAFSIVIGLIVDLDRVHSGNLRISQQPIIDLDHKLGSSPP